MDILSNHNICLSIRRQKEPYPNYKLLVSIFSGFLSKFPSSTLIWSCLRRDHRTFCVIFLLYTSHIFREPLDYIKDVFNYLDLSGYFLFLATYVFRYLGSDAQWTCASLAIMINFIGIFKYSAVDR